MDTCLVYCAKTTTDPIPEGELIRINEQGIRSHARAHATGLRIIAGGLVLGIIEAPMAEAEHLLDDAQDAQFWGEPEILLAMPIKSRAFERWKQVVAKSLPNPEEKLSLIRAIAEKAQHHPNGVKPAIKRMISLMQSGSEQRTAA